jgi:hypothetical protein
MLVSPMPASPSFPAHCRMSKVDGIVFRPFTPAKRRIIAYAVWPDGMTSGLVTQFLGVAHAVTAPADTAVVRLGGTGRHPNEVLTAGSAAPERRVERKSVADRRQGSRRV